jgi:hypothetical protein
MRELRWSPFAYESLRLAKPTDAEFEELDKVLALILERPDQIGLKVPFQVSYQTRVVNCGRFVLEFTTNLLITAFYVERQMMEEFKTTRESKVSKFKRV